MDNTTNAQVEALWDEILQESLLLDYANVAALSLYCYDFMLTFAQQLQFLRGKKLSLSTLLFSLLHVCALCSILFLSVLGWDIPCEVYLPLWIVSGITTIVFGGVTAAITSLRVYALSRNNVYIAFIVAALSFPQIVFNIYNLGTTRKGATSILVCTIFNDVSAVSLNDCEFPYSYLLTADQKCVQVNTVGIVTGAMSQVIVMLVTWRSTYATQQLKAAASGSGGHGRLLPMLLRDGTLLFGMVFLADISNLVLSYTNGFQGSSILVFVLDVILLSRFLMNLRSVVEGLGEGSSFPPQTQASIQQSFGGEIIFAGDEPDRDEDDYIVGLVEHETEEDLDHDHAS